MRLRVTSGDVMVEVWRHSEEILSGVELNYTNASEPGTDAPYTVSAGAASTAELRALIACAEGDNDTATRVLNVLDRTEDLMNEWQAAVKGK